MNRVRTCGISCHTALGSRCQCWCDGIFHGEARKAIREEFLESMNKGIATGKPPDEVINEFIESVPLLRYSRDDRQWIFQTGKGKESENL